MPVYVSAPGNFVPKSAIAFAASDGQAVGVDAEHPLPVSLTRTPPAPVAGTVSNTGVSAALAAVPGRAITVALAGTWTGRAAIERSTDGGATWLPLTVGGQPWGVYTANANEPAWSESEDGASFRLTVALTTGTLGYRIAQ